MKLGSALIGVLAAVPTLGASAQADNAMKVADLKQICAGADAASKAACRFYVLGVVQGIRSGMEIADGKAGAGMRPCIPDDLPGSAMELFVKAKIGEDLAIYPADRNLDAAGFVAGIVTLKFACRGTKAK